MAKIREIISSIYGTECEKFIKEGSYLSDPIVTRDNTGLIDNFYIYECSDDCSEVAGPIVSFGIYAGTKKTAYIKENANLDELEIISNTVSGGEELFDQYERDFSEIREWVMKDIDEEKKNILNRYVKSLSQIFGEGVMKIYRSAVPDFFDWADKYK